MADYEGLILARQEDFDSDDCKSCPYKGDKTCKNQCMEVTVSVFSIEEGRYVKSHKANH